MRLIPICGVLSVYVLLVGCGFHLRGTHTAALVPIYQHIHLDLPDNAMALQQPLTVALSSMGATVDANQTQSTLKIQHYQLQRQPLSGRLSEVRLRLSVNFVLTDPTGRAITEPRQLVAQRSYQYDMATVNTERQEETFLIGQMQEDIAGQIVRQLHRNRLPDLKQARTTNLQLDAAP